MVISYLLKYLNISLQNGVSIVKKEITKIISIWFISIYLYIPFIIAYLVKYCEINYPGINRKIWKRGRTPFHATLYVYTYVALMSFYPDTASKRFSIFPVASLYLHPTFDLSFPIVLLALSGFVSLSLLRDMMF